MLFNREVSAFYNWQLSSIISVDSETELPDDLIVFSAMSKESEYVANERNWRMDYRWLVRQSLRTIEIIDEI